MSKLSRFKKARSLKLPRQKTSGADSEDDDFLSTRPNKCKMGSSGDAKEQLVAVESCTDSSRSAYFAEPIAPVSSKENQDVRGEGKRVKLKQNHANLHTDNKTTKTRATRVVHHVERLGPDGARTENDGLAVSVDQDENAETGRVVCPFCWKKLSDKLSGTTHVKTCAKDIPIQQVFEAMQLQEKQIQEWERLGLAFPGFSSAAVGKMKGKTGAASSREKGTKSASKKPSKVADADLELALALSASLHEEFETRTKRENQFLIENGLENEVGLIDSFASCERESDLPTSTRSTIPNEALHRLPPPQVRRRGKKVQPHNLPLYTVNSVQRSAIIGERVARILEEHDTSSCRVIEEQYISDKLDTQTLGVPKRLSKFQKTETHTSLWNLSKEADVPKESFRAIQIPTEIELRPPERTTSSVEEVSLEPKVTVSSHHQFTNAGGNSYRPCSIPDENISTTKKLESSDSRRGSKTSSTFLTERVEGCRNETLASSWQSLPCVIRDLAKMLTSRTDCDLVIYGREEKPIYCHRFMIMARCPQLLNERIIEEKSTGVTRCVIPLTEYASSVVKAFRWYIYTGEVQLSGHLLDDLKDLGHKYGIDIIQPGRACVQCTSTKISEKSSTIEKRRPSTANKKVQTEMTAKQDNSTMTEACASDHDHSFNSDSTSQEFNGSCEELFKTLDYTVLQESDVPHTEDAEDDGRSVDLFEEDEALAEHTPKIVKETSNGFLNDGHEKNQSTSVSNIAVKYTPEELKNSKEYNFYAELLTPDSQKRNMIRVSDKKRSRSVSPLVDPSGDMYTATQIADILQLHQRGEDACAYMNKANKKQKFDDSDCDFELLGLVIENDIEFNNDAVNIANVTNVSTATDGLNGTRTLSRPQSCSKRLLKCKSVSTPNLNADTGNNLLFSPYHNLQINSELDYYDPLQDAGDDSIFANINTPNDVLASLKEKSLAGSCHSLIPQKPTKSGHNHQDTLGTPSRTSRRISPRDLSIHVDKVSSLSATKNILQKERGKKTKAAPKIKLTSRSRNTISSKQDSSASISQRTSIDRGETDMNGRSPMLNYSLLDTPILKQELKKYGVKPLPRSKAKVLLRHIYKETRK